MKTEVRRHAGRPHWARAISFLQAAIAHSEPTSSTATTIPGSERKGGLLQFGRGLAKRPVRPLDTGGTLITSFSCATTLRSTRTSTLIRAGRAHCAEVSASAQKAPSSMDWKATATPSKATTLAGTLATGVQAISTQICNGGMYRLPRACGRKSSAADITSPVRHWLEVIGLGAA